MLVFGLLDGRRTVQDIQLEMVRQKKGLFIPSDQILGLINEFDTLFLLDGPRYRKAKQDLMADYQGLDTRGAALAGQAYPSEPAALRSFLEAVLNSDSNLAPAMDARRLCALAAPHIDMETGKRVYAAGYRAVRDLGPERIVLLGTGHAIEDGYFSLTDKDFETPFGRVKTDMDWVKALRAAGRGAVCSNDFPHRREHSIEFELLFLQHLFGSGFTAVPILCGSFQRDLEAATRPGGIPAVGRFLTALRRLIRDSREKVLVVAGIDFSHIGLKFGHGQRAGSLLLEARKHDHALIEAACRGDVEAFWAESRRVGDKYNVCGFSALACLLEALPEVQGRLLGYEFSQEEPTQSAVSYAAIAFTHSQVPAG
ncbi:MAG: AmmeMemoRadiSam system protein B [Acidobacteriota bacterium]|nr:AmmeMemoRadiSam system protein B [Acidobacteriota bacterium]